MVVGFDLVCCTSYLSCCSSEAAPFCMAWLEAWSWICLFFVWAANWKHWDAENGLCTYHSDRALLHGLDTRREYLFLFFSFFMIISLPSTLMTTIHST